MKRAFLFLIVAAFSLEAQWNPFGGGGGGGAGGGGGSNSPPYTATFLTSDTSKAVTGATHGQGTKPAVLACYFNSGAQFEPLSVSTPNGSGDFTITLSTSAVGTAGYCLIGGAGTGGGGGGGGSATPGGSANDTQYNSGGSLSGAGNATATNMFWSQVSSGSPTFTALVAGDIPSLDAAKITTGTFNSARIPSLDGSIIGAGTVAVARLPSIPASQTTSGTFATARIPDMTLGGDLSGTVSAATVAKLLGRSLCVATPSDAQILTYNSGSSCWGPVTPGATSALVSFANTDTALTISAHGLGANVQVDNCWKVSGSTATWFMPTGWQRDTSGSPYSILLSLSTPAIGTAGACLLTNGGGGGSGGGGGAVSSVFGRSGVVSATSGDYLASQVTNAFNLLVNNDVGAHYIDMGTQTAPASPAASKFRVFANATTGKLACTDSAGADCMPATGGGGGSGYYDNSANDANNTTSAGRPIEMTAIAKDTRVGAVSGNGSVYTKTTTATRTLGDVLKWDVDGNAVGGGQVRTQLCGVVWATSTTLTFAPSASASTPCVVGKFGVPYVLASPITITISGSSGTVWPGFDAASGLPIVYQSTSGLAACSTAGCTVSTSSTPPASFIPSYAWTVGSGTVASNAGTNLACELCNGGYPAAGAGMAAPVFANGQATFAIDTAQVPTHLPVQTATIDFASTATAACASTTVTVSGIADGARVLVGAPTALNGAGRMFSGGKTATNTATVQFCNLTGSTLDLASGSYTIEVVQ